MQWPPTCGLYRVPAARGTSHQFNGLPDKALVSAPEVSRFAHSPGSEKPLE
jgi:hypothetical protein